MCLKGEAAICGARLLSGFRQGGAHLWHEGPAGGLGGIRNYNLLTLARLEVQALPLSYLLLLDVHVSQEIYLLRRGQVSLRTT